MAGNATIGALRVILGADSAALEKGLKDASASLSSFAKSVQTAGVAIGGSLGALMGGVALGIRMTINEADKMGKMAQSIGVPVEELSKLKHAADLSDVSLESLGKSMGRLSKSMMGIAGGKQDDVSQTFNALGISVKNADGSLKSASQVMTEVAGRFGNMEDGAGKTAIAMRLFGRSGAELIPMLNAGKTGLQEMMQEAEALGIVVDTKTAKSAEAFNDNLTRMGKVAEGIILKITAEMLPAFQHMSNMLVDVSKNSDLMKTAASGIVTALKNAVEAALTAGLVFQRLGAEVSALWQVLMAPNWEAMKAAWAGFQTAGEETRQKFEGLKDFIGRFWQDSAAAAESTSQDTGRKLAAPVVVASEVVKKLAAEGEAAWKKIEAAGKKMVDQTRTPLEEFRQKLADINMLFWQGQIDAETYARAIAQAQDKLTHATPAAQELGSALSATFNKALEGGQKFGDLLKDLALNLAKMAANRMFQTLLFGNAGSGGTSTGILGSLFSGFKLPGFASGGSFEVRGSGGIDSQIAAFRVTPGERVSVSKKGEGAGGVSVPVVINADFRGADANAVAGISVKLAQLQRSIPGMVEQTISGRKIVNPGLLR
jgi:hypothetical protein